MDKKKAYEEKLNAQLDEWDAKIDVLKAKADKAGSDAKINYKETIEKLEKQRANAKDSLQELRAASDDAWEDLKDGIEDTWSSLGDAIKSATSRFN